MKRLIILVLIFIVSPVILAKSFAAAPAKMINEAIKEDKEDKKEVKKGKSEYIKKESVLIFDEKEKKFFRNGKKGRPLWLNFDTGANVKAIALEGDVVWLGLPNGIIKYDTRTLNEHTIYTTQSTGGSFISNGIYAIKIDSKNKKWFGTYGGGLTSFDGENWTTYTPYGAGSVKTYGENWRRYKKGEGLGDLWVYDMLLETDGTMAVATWKGVSFFDGEKFKTYTEADGIVDKWVYAIAKDKEGVIWLGTEGGITVLYKDGWKTYTHKDGLGAVMIEKEREKDKEIEHHSTQKKTITKSNPNYVLAIAVDKDNNKWFGTWGSGLSKFDGKEWITYTAENGLGGNFIHCLNVDEDGVIWAGTDGGLSFFLNGKWHNYTVSDGLLDNNVFSIAFDKKGNKWIGTWAGLSKLEIVY